MASGFGFTTRATCLLAAGATALVCGLALGEADLARAGVLALAVPLVAALVVHRSRVLIANRRAAEPTHASSGDAVVVSLTITNRSRLSTGAMMLEDQLPPQLDGRARFVLDGLASREARTVSYRLPNLPRGRYRTGPLRVRLTDPFHLVDLMRSFAATSEFVVRPIIEHLPPVAPPLSYDIGDSSGSHSIGAHGADDASAREYRTGDDLRKIHWRASAHQGALMVRQAERPWQGQATVLLDLRESAHAASRDRSVPGDERERSSLEWAVSAAASIGTHLMSAGRAVELVCDLTAEAKYKPGSALLLAEYLATVRAVRQATLAPSGRLLVSSARETALIAVLGELDVDSLRVLAECHPRGSAVPAVALLLDTPTWRGDEPSADGSSIYDAARILRGAGWRVSLVRRGMALTDVWRDALRTSGVGVSR